MTLSVSEWDGSACLSRAATGTAQRPVMRVDDLDPKLTRYQASTWSGRRERMKTPVLCRVFATPSTRHHKSVRHSHARRCRRARPFEDSSEPPWTACHHARDRIRSHSLPAP